MITIHEVEPGGPEWHALRAPLYTGSNADRLLRFGLIEYSLNQGASFGGNFYTRRGHILEDEAIELYQEIYGHRVLHGREVGFVTNSKWPQLGYSPDGFDVDLDVPLEVKAFNEAKHLAMAAGSVPMKVEAQIHFGQFVWEKKGARLLIYNPDLDDPTLCLKVIDIRFNRNIHNNFKRILGGIRHAA